MDFSLKKPFKTCKIKLIVIGIVSNLLSIHASYVKADAVVNFSDQQGDNATITLNNSYTVITGGYTTYTFEDIDSIQINNVYISPISTSNSSDTTPFVTLDANGNLFQPTIAISGETNPDSLSATYSETSNVVTGYGIGGGFNQYIVLAYSTETVTLIEGVALDNGIYTFSASVNQPIGAPLYNNPNYYGPCCTTMYYFPGFSTSLYLNQSPQFSETLPSAVPLPAAIWLFGSSFSGFIGFNLRGQFKRNKFRQL